MSSEREVGIRKSDRAIFADEESLNQHISRLFQIESQLNDLHTGRGFYNTFNAYSHFMRWPLDHVYVTDEFEVLKLERLAAFGSDHFPLYVELVLRKKAKVAQNFSPIYCQSKL